MKPIRKVSHPDHIASFFFSQWFVLILITLTGFGYNLGMLGNPFFRGKLIDAIHDGVFYTDMNVIYRLCGLYLGVIIGVQVCRALKRYFVRHFAFEVTAMIRLNVYNSILNEEEAALKKEKIGTLISRTMSDVYHAVEGMRKLTTEIFDTIVLFVVYIVYLFLFDVKATLFALIPIAVAVLTAFLIRTWIYRLSSKARSVHSKLSGATFALFDNALAYRIYGRDDANLKAYDSTLTEYEKASRNAQVLRDVMIPLVENLALAGLIPAVYFTTQYVIRSMPLANPAIGFGETEWTVGTFSTYLSSFIYLSQKASHTARLFSSVESGLASWKRIRPYLKPYQEYAKGTCHQDTDTISFDHYRLTIGEHTLIENLSFEARKGEIIGITGPVASGKSAFGKTVMKKLAYEGHIMVFGQDLQEYPLADVEKTIGYLSHQPELITDTIEANIAYGESKDVMPVLHQVAFDEDLKSMPDGKDTLVGNEGVKLSGGQQARIALARTFYHDKPMIILDDPFANIDIRTESEILSDLDKEKHNHVIFLISHRLSAFPNLDKILVLNTDGHVDVGTHRELLESSETYRSLWRLQQQGETQHD